MADSIGPPRTSSATMSRVSEAPPAAGNFLGSAIYGGVEAFVTKHGPAAAHAVIAKLSAGSRAYVRPNVPALGILGAKRYPYAFVGELVRTMASVARADEDVFCREYAAAGIDYTLATVNRVVLRYAVTPQALAARAQELWTMFHDAGRVTIRTISETEYVAVLSDWPSHDVTVCKVCMEARRRVVERTGVKDVEVRREKCQAWGHDVCETRVRWTR